MPNTQERRSAKRIDCFHHSISDAEIEHSLVIDISKGGAGLLLAKKKSFFRADDPGDHPAISSNVQLMIFHPDSALHEGASVNAKVAWVDHDYSGHHRKIGVSFSDMDGDQSIHISKLTEWLSKDSNYFLHCELRKN